MRVLIVNNYAHVTGGADLHCLEITDGLRERGHEVGWLATSSPENIETSGEFVPLVVTAKNRDQLSLRRRLDAARRALWNPAAAHGMGNLIDRYQPDVVHVHKAYVQLSVAPIVVASRRGLPLVQTVHDYEFISASPFDSTGAHWDHDDARRSYQAVNSLTFAGPRRIHRDKITRWIAVSRVVADRYRSVGGIDCEVIPNFTSPSTREPTPLKDRDGMLFLGRLSREKGIGDLIEAAKTLPELKFRFAGDGPLRNEVEAAASTLGNVDYVGFVSKEEGAELLSTSIACLMPSIWEDPGPLACLEAMAQGTPVVSYPMGGIAEYVQDAGAGLVCAEVGAQSLVESISRLLSDPESWRDFSADGISAVRGVHSRATYLDSLEAVYESAISIGR